MIAYFPMRMNVQRLLRKRQQICRSGAFSDFFQRVGTEEIIVCFFDE
ncbi:hypothetical protein CPter291_0912 [Collimonas pratensis]|uniref:Uncharacterized protein n=1 Tax=Collimonas pratensis TaxID=279113 RepID=A0ABM5Z287_9BURK|nr:hypothetical protein CPter291_0912 [Collimonas pratensis]